MNEPHVEKLHYKIIANEGVDYENASPILIENDIFQMAVENNKVTFVMRKHFSIEQDARVVTDEYLKAWEIQIGLEHSPGEIRFDYDHAEIIDLRPESQCDIRVLHASLSSSARLDAIIVGHVKRGKYPAPPDHFIVSSDVETMYLRYKAYCENRDSLLSMAYLLLTVFQSKHKTRAEAAESLAIDRDILDMLGDLCTEKGDRMEARKAPREGAYVPLSDEERQWVIAACKLLIRRQGEYEFSGNANLRVLGMDNLPPLKKTEIKHGRWRSKPKEKP